MRQSTKIHSTTRGFHAFLPCRAAMEIEERVEMLEFVLGDEPGIPYSFACVAVGDALTLTTTLSVEDRGMTERAAEGLEGQG